MVDQKLILDLEVDLDATSVEEKTRGMDIAQMRSTPSKALRPRVERSAGIYTRSSTLSVAVRLSRGADARTLLAGDVLWNAQFYLYPEPSTGIAETPNPHLQPEEFTARVSWSISQEVGMPEWAIAALKSDDLSRVGNALLAAFSKNGLAGTLR
jgi:hypothetical protein